MKNNNIIRITKIFSRVRDEICLKHIIIEGHLLPKKGDIFYFPCASSAVDIVPLKREKKRIIQFSASDIRTKCVMFIINEKRYSVSILHV